MLLNLIISYKVTKCIISPPIFFNIGFVVACYFAILYYKEWDMQLLRMNTFLSIALGCSFFSLMSILLIKTCDKNNRSTISVFQPSNIFKRLRLKYFLFLCCILQILVLFLKIHFYKAAFGGYLSFSELLFASRMNFIDEDSVSVFPFWFRNVMQLFTVLNFLFYALFSNLVFLREKKNRYLIVLLIVNILLQMGCSLFDGARGGVVSSLSCFILIFIMKFFQWTGRRNLPIKVLARFFVLAIFIGILMKTSAEFVGRDTKEESSLYYFAYYCGGEIKNLDIYMGNEKFSNHFGDATFLGLYSELNKYISINVPKVAENTFSEYKGLNLGNVYTTFYNFYYDGGLWGVMIFSTIMSVMSTNIFLKIRRNKTWNLSLSEFVYAQVCFSLLMCFFSNRFYTEIICVSFVKKIVYFLVVSYFFNKTFLKIKQYGKNSCCDCYIQ